MTIQQAFELALQHHQSGRLAEAEGIYRQILAAEPRHADALHSLGVIALQVGRSDIAVESIGKAIAIDPNQHVYHCNLGEAHRNARHPGEAIAAYHQALLLKPGYPEAYYNLGITLISLARTEEGISAYRRAIQFRPDYADAHFNLGAALASRGDMEDAVAAFQIGLRFMPQLAEGHHCLGNALAAMGRLDEAITAFRSALQLEPGLAKVHNDLGVLLAERGLSEQAITAYRHALQLQPDLPEIHNNLGNALRNQGRIEEAIAAHRRAIEIKPDYAEAHNNLGVDLQDKGLLDDADAAFRLAIRHKPDYAEAHSNLGNLLKDLARFDEALASYRRAVSLRPEDAGLHSNLIYASLFHPGVNAPTAREEGSRWERQHARHSAALPHRHGDRPNALRRLKVGYVSPDFRHHVISHFLTPLLETHDRTQFEIHCYSSVRRPDAFTDRLMKSADHWKDVRGIRDETLAKMIRADGIDILVDLTQHMADNRLPLFARKPAPVQVAWLGYPGSTGLSAIDYRFTDAFMEPEGSTWSESVETPVRLPDSWFCFDPLDGYPEPSPLPAPTAGHITFGSLNNFCKINDGVLQLWTRVLRAVEGSRLLMQCPVGSAQERVRNWFELSGIAAHRLDLVSKTPTRAEFMRLFERFDIALETFPYNGGTTTCEALWMGIPVPTFPGTTAVSRIGLSIPFGRRFAGIRRCRGGGLCAAGRRSRRRPAETRGPSFHVTSADEVLRLYERPAIHEECGVRVSADVAEVVRGNRILPDLIAREAPNAGRNDAACLIPAWVEAPPGRLRRNTHACLSRSNRA